LQQPEVQLASFGRLLNGEADTLVGYVLARLEISDPQVVDLSGKAVHSIARRTGRDEDRIEGFVFLLSPEELEAADRYEVDAYARVEAELLSGSRAYFYAGPDL
jgi:hypothetical protein